VAPVLGFATPNRAPERLYRQAKTPQFRPEPLSLRETTEYPRVDGLRSGDVTPKPPAEAPDRLLETQKSRVRTENPPVKRHNREVLRAYPRVKRPIHRPALLTRREGSLTRR
jgi:hypothetical protein